LGALAFFPRVLLCDSLSIRIGLPLSGRPTDRIDAQGFLCVRLYDEPFLVRGAMRPRTNIALPVSSQDTAVLPRLYSLSSRHGYLCFARHPKAYLTGNSRVIIRSNDESVVFASCVVARLKHPYVAALVPHFIRSRRASSRRIGQALSRMRADFHDAEVGSRMLSETSPSAARYEVVPVRKFRSRPPFVFRRKDGPVRRGQRLRHYPNG